MDYFKLIILTGSLSLLNACGDSSGGGGGPASVSPSLPADAIILTTSNANSVAQSATSTADTTAVLVGIEASLPAPQAAINTLTDYVFDKSNRTSSIATGITTTDSCPNGGTVTDSYNGSTTSISGSFNFNQCDFGNFKFNGNFSYSSTWNDNTGAYTDTGNGSLTLTTPNDSYSMAMNFTDTGNDISGDSSITLSFSISGANLGGFLVTTSQPLTSTNFTTASAGQLIVTGANNTRLRITITSSTSADIEFDNGSGSFVFLNSIFI
ncbi:hypothetical protein MNBD_GAMMA09-1385 [hydrothermal vent metagenome]|uniref:Uncharacterized protein n=1 Tax=hydrothermal vent metagenome TaxID=652676 RepID=A0A3B0XI52_9ZZZZ